MIEVSREMGSGNLSAFYLGGIPGAAEYLAERLENRFPSLRRAGTYSPPFG